MPGKNSLSPGEAHKQLLIAESEMHRALLLEEGQAIVNEVGELAQKAGHVFKMASAAAAAVAALSALRGKSSEPDGKRSIVRTLLNGLRLGTSVWMAIKKARQD